MEFARIAALYAKELHGKPPDLEKEWNEGEIPLNCVEGSVRNGKPVVVA